MRYLALTAAALVAMTGFAAADTPTTAGPVQLTAVEMDTVTAGSRVRIAPPKKHYTPAKPSINIVTQVNVAVVNTIGKLNTVIVAQSNSN